MPGENVPREDNVRIEKLDPRHERLPSLRAKKVHGLTSQIIVGLCVSKVVKPVSCGICKKRILFQASHVLF